MTDNTQPLHLFQLVDKDCLFEMCLPELKLWHAQKDTAIMAATSLLGTHWKELCIEKGHERVDELKSNLDRNRWHEYEPHIETRATEPDAIKDREWEDGSLIHINTCDGLLTRSWCVVEALVSWEYRWFRREEVKHKKWIDNAWWGKTTMRKIPLTGWTKGDKMRLTIWVREVELEVVDGGE